MYKYIRTVCIYVYTVRFHITSYHTKVHHVHHDIYIISYHSVPYHILPNYILSYHNISYIIYHVSSIIHHMSYIIYHVSCIIYHVISHTHTYVYVYFDVYMYVYVYRKSIYIYIYICIYTYTTCMYRVLAIQPAVMPTTVLIIVRLSLGSPFKMELRGLALTSRASGSCPVGIFAAQEGGAQEKL